MHTSDVQYPPHGGANPTQGGVYYPLGGANPPQEGSYPPQGRAYHPHPPQPGYVGYIPPQPGYSPAQPPPAYYPQGKVGGLQHARLECVTLSPLHVHPSSFSLHPHFPLTSLFSRCTAAGEVVEVVELFCAVCDVVIVPAGNKNNRDCPAQGHHQR